ncbi:hypothetical protein [Euzebya sp.]|uniref:hypothetical protein n=1 Tax=Euzebya sp. TaxID=1971409 RepID=UPI0035146D00
MRELYAAALYARESTNHRARPFIDEWMDKHRDGSALIHIDDASDGSRVCRLEQTLNGVQWRTEILHGAPDERAHVTIRIGIRAAATGSIAPLEYEFKSPALVRTLLRELDVYDGEHECHADPVPEVGPSQVGDLVTLMQSDSRRLPVIVVSRTSRGSDLLLDPVELSRQLAGMAHVRVMSTPQSSWTLTDVVGAQLSVYDGALRVYFPSFTPDDDPYRHRLTFPDRISDRTVGQLRSWMGTLAAAAVTEHPARAQLREDRRVAARAAIEGSDVNDLRELLQLYEADNEDLTAHLRDERQRAVDLETDLSRTRAKAEALEEQFKAVKHRGRPVGPVDAAEPATVADAVDRIEELAETTWYAGKVELTDGAIMSARGFASYKKPGELLRATQAVMEAGALVHHDHLGEPPADFFARRGFGYGAQPSPHLKVDEATSPDQCLRIYWDVDDDTRTWTITSIGPHA